jgi:hypothetical protein
MNGGVRLPSCPSILVALLALAAACGPSYVEIKPSEPLTADAPRVHADVTRLWLSDEARTRGLADDIELVVELRVRNDDTRARKISPGSFSCLLELDARRPGETRALLPGGGGEGAFPGEPPDEGSLLTAVTIPAGQSRDLWAIFHGYRFDGSDRPRRARLDVPLDDGALHVDLADPARGALTWETPAIRSSVTIGLRDLTLFAGGLHATIPSTEIVLQSRRGPVLWDVGLVSTVLVQSQGPLVSSTSSFTGSGLTAHLTAPFASWGASEDARQLGFFAGGTASFLVEMLTPSAARMNSMNMIGPHAYGLFTAEGGLEFDVGAARFAASPFPLTPAQRPLPAWGFRFGYAQAWAGSATGGGLLTSFRFTW